MAEHPPVLTLAIETSNPSAATDGQTGPGVAAGLTAPGSCELLGVEPLGTGDRHDDLLLPAIDLLFARLGRRPAEIGRVAVSIGPGGYTGLRMATAAANLIAMTTGSPVVGIPSARVVARVVARSLAAPAPVHVCLASKNDSAWVTRFDAEASAIDDGRLCTAGDLELAPGEVLVGDRFLPASFRERAGEVGCEVRPPVFDPARCLELAWAVPPREAGQVTPLYGREAEAVTRWRELHGGG